MLPETFLLENSIKRNRSDSTIYNKENTHTCNRLRRRGYPDWSLKKVMEIVDKILRSKLLEEKQKRDTLQITQDKPITFLTTYSPQLSQQYY